MNIRRLMPAITGVAILGLWAGAFVVWGRAGAADASPERPGADGEVKQKIDDLKATVVGKNDETRGKVVVAPPIKAPAAVWDYTPREVCLQGKMNFPEQYKDVDCSDEKYSSPYGWREVKGMH